MAAEVDVAEALEADRVAATAVHSLRLSRLTSVPTDGLQALQVPAAPATQLPTAAEYDRQLRQLRHRELI